MSEASRIAEFMQRTTREAASQVTRKIGLQALSGLVLRTPVDSGRARGAWSVGVRSAPGGTGDPDKSGAATIARGSSTIGTQQGFDEIILENNVPYINRLDDGHSGQAPQGMTAGMLASLGLGTGR